MRCGSVWCVLACAALAFASCAGNRQVQVEVRRMEIADIDISTIADGVYEGSYSYLSTVQSVAVHVTAGRIVAIDVLEGSETEHGLRGRAVLDEIIERQRTDVDAISGATTTSKAYLKAVELALLSAPRR